MKTKLFLTTLLFLLSTSIFYAQNKKETVIANIREAIRLMDAGKIEESQKLLKETQKLDPTNFTISYEMAYSHYLDEDYKGAIKILEKTKEHKDVNERLYQLLGNSYDILGNSKKALEAYQAGLKKFPNAGSLYLEQGNVFWNKKEYEKALPYYEKGIYIDPSFPSNYYRATILYCSSSEEVWGLIYGEIFMNLERNTRRTTEISKLLFDTYKREVKFTSDSTVGISLCQRMTMTPEDFANPEKIKLPFCMTFGAGISIAVAFEKKIDIASLNRIRTNFLNFFYEQKHNETYPNVLYDYQKKIQDLGYLEAYNHWIMMKGDEDGFDNWQAENEEKWEAFVKWFSENPLVLDKDNKFYQGQY